jgi:hypothetical protein
MAKAIRCQVENVIVNVARHHQEYQSYGPEGSGRPVQGFWEAGMAEPDPDSGYQCISQAGQFDPVADHDDNVS